MKRRASAMICCRALPSICCANVRISRKDVDEAVNILKEGESLSKKDGTYAEQAQMKLLSAQIYRDCLYAKSEQSPEDSEVKGGKSLKWLFEVTLRKAQGAVKLARNADDSQLLASTLQTMGEITFFDHRVQDTMTAAEE